tara:strand:- start:19 stop:207 length:189 start_codon:yes stop_codon:yes gene_type:complete
MGHIHEFTFPAKPDISIPIGKWCMKKRDVGLYGRYGDDRVFALGERVLDDFPARKLPIPARR